MVLRKAEKGKDGGHLLFSFSTFARHMKHINITTKNVTFVPPETVESQECGAILTIPTCS